VQRLKGDPKKTIQFFRAQNEWSSASYRRWKELEMGHPTARNATMLYEADSWLSERSIESLTKLKLARFIIYRFSNRDGRATKAIMCS